MGSYVATRLINNLHPPITIQAASNEYSVLRSARSSSESTNATQVWRAFINRYSSDGVTPTNRTEKINTRSATALVPGQSWATAPTSASANPIVIYEASAARPYGRSWRPPRPYAGIYIIDAGEIGSDASSAASTSVNHTLFWSEHNPGIENRPIRGRRPTKWYWPYNVRYDSAPLPGTLIGHRVHNSYCCYLPVQRPRSKDRSLLQEAGASTVDLTPATIVFSAVALNPVPGVITINLTPAILNFSSIALNPVPGLITINLTPAALVFSAIILNPIPGVITVNLNSAVLVFSGAVLNPVPGPVTVNLATATLAFSAVALNPVPGSSGSTVNLSPAILIFTPVTLAPKEGMFFTMTTFGPPPMQALPCSWQVDIACCPEWPTFSADLQLAGSEYGTVVVWSATGRRFGLCERTVRPCGLDCALDEGIGGYYWSEGTWIPYLFNGMWRNYACNCGFPNCAPQCQVWLPGTVNSVTSVTVNGVVINPLTYRVDDYKWLVRNHDISTSDCWPTKQDYNLDSGVGTFIVAYLQGIPVPGVLRRAAGILGCEWVKACLGQPCRLPGRISSLARQGVTVSMVDPSDLLRLGLTGIKEVDDIITAFNPHGVRGVPRFYSPDLPVSRTVTSP